MTFPAHLLDSFRFRLFAAFSLMIFILMPVLGYLSFLQAKKGVEHQLEQFATATATQVTGRIHEYLSHHSSGVRLIKAFLENGLVDGRDSQALIHFFHLLRHNHPGFVNILYGDRRGNFVMVPPQPPEIHLLFDPRRRPWYQGALHSREVSWSPVYQFASTRRPGITASLPVVDRQGHIQGVCGIDIDLSTFSTFLANLQISGQGFVSIIENSTGHVVAHPELIKRHPDMDIISRFSSCLADLRASGRHAGITSCRGKLWFTAYADYPGNDWSVCITLPESEYLAEIRKIQRTTFTLLIAGLCLASGISYIFTRTLISPMEKLEQGIKKISAGDLDSRVEVNSPDLVASIATAVNDMASSLKKSRQTLKKTLVELAEKEKMAALGQLTAGIAHEIKNPLGIIQGSAEIMADSRKPLTMRERAARFVIDEVQRLNKTIKGFLAFARPSPPARQTVSPQVILEETLALCEEQLHRHHIRVKRSFADQPLWCHLDPDQLHQVFMNLILNSIQAMPDGGLLHCQVKVEDDQHTRPAQKVAITIGDTGHGLGPDQLERVFEPFVSFRDEGTGLGLSIVRQIVTRHGGEIVAQSERGQGTTFFIFFPLVTEESIP